MKYISILGSTGSIGKNCLRAAKHLGEDCIKVVALAANQNIDLLEHQALEFNPQLLAVYDSDKALELQRRIPHIPVLSGMEGLKEVAMIEKCQLVVSAISGTIGLIPTIAAINSGKDIGFACKEVLVSGGEIITSLVKKNNVNLIPIDSELTALFQCLKGESSSSVKRLLITASGGPFLNYSESQLQNVTVDHALRHPNYRMGPKVTIDSSTLMNKGLEMIEAHWLFEIPLNQIEVIIHPQQIIHSMVEFVDNSILAQMGDADMIVPIQYALTYPERKVGALKPFNFLQHNKLEFFSPDINKFRCLKLAYDAISCGGSLPCFMNAANEIFVQRFLKCEISWNQIPIFLEKLMDRHSIQPMHSIDDLLEIDRMAREEACKLS